MTCKTGGICPESGEWKPDCEPGERYTMKEGEKVPPCHCCDRAVTWTLVE